MRIALISFKGMERYTIQLANSMSKLCEVLVIFESKNSFDFNNLLSSKVKFVNYKSDRLRSLSNFFINLAILKKVFNFNPDVIHYQATSLWFSIFLPLLKNYPSIVTLHDIQSHTGSYSFRTRIDKWFFRKYSDRIIVHGEKLRQALIQIYNCDVNKVKVIPHGNYDFYLKKMTESNVEYSNYIMFFGRVIEYKGLQYLIEAFPEISENLENIKLLIAGSGDSSYLNYCKRLANDNKNIIFIDRFIEDSEVGPLFHNSSIVIAPYIEASQSGVINIAYTFGKPVIATNVGSLPEIVSNNKTGLLVAPKNSKAISDAVINLIEDKSLRKKMESNCRLISKTVFSWDNIASKTFKIYNSLKQRTRI